MARSDDCRLDHVRRVRAGSLFGAYRATLGGGEVAIKRPNATPAWDSARASAWTRYGRSYAYRLRQIGWAEGQPALAAAYLEQLVRYAADASRVASVA